MASKKKALVCSFCGESAKKVRQLIAGPGVHICGDCVRLCAEIIAGKTTAPRSGQAFGDLASQSSDELLGTLQPASVAAQSMQELLWNRVQELRRRGVTWEQIGEALGVSRQAAWQRFTP